MYLCQETIIKEYLFCSHHAPPLSRQKIHVVELSTHYVKIQHNDNIICGALCQNVAGF